MIGRHSLVVLFFMAAIPAVAAEPKAIILQAHKGAVYSAEFSADGKLILTNGEDNVARLWDAGTGKSLKEFPCPPKGRFGTMANLGLARVSPDGRRVLTVSSPMYSHDANSWPGGGTACAGGDVDYGEAARIWDATTGKVLAHWEPDVDQAIGFNGTSPFGAAFSPDSTRVATTFGTWPDCAVRVHESQGGNEIARLKGHEQPVVDVAFSPDSKLIATACLEGTVGIWDAATGQRLRTCKGNGTDIVGVTFSPDGNSILGWGSNSTHHFEKSGGGSSNNGFNNNHTPARIWAVKTGTEMRTLTWENPNQCFLWFYGLSTTLKWGDPPMVFFPRARFSRDGTRILTDGISSIGTLNHGHPCLWNVATGKRVRSFVSEEPRDVLTADFRPDGLRIAIAGKSGLITLWDATTGNKLKTLKGHAKAVRTVIFSPDGKRLLSASEDGTARVWDLADE